MNESGIAETGLLPRLEGVGSVQHRLVEVMEPERTRRVSELSAAELKGFWDEALKYAQNEIGSYGTWWRQVGPVLPDGYDAEVLVQTAFERLILREAAGCRVQNPDGAAVLRMEGTETEIQRELRSLIKHRVRWLHERREMRLVKSEWDVVAGENDGGPRESLFELLPGRSAMPDEELMRKEKEQAAGRFKAEFEARLGERRDLVEFFRRVWEGDKRREIAGAMRAGVRRVKALRAQLKRKLVRFGARRVLLGEKGTANPR